MTSRRPWTCAGTVWASAMDRGYAAPIWMTFKQALELGGGLAFAKVTALGPRLRLRFTSFDRPAAAARDAALVASTPA